MKTSKILKRTEKIARNEMIAFGRYVSPTVVNPALAATGAICGGRTACAIGATYLAAGEAYTTRSMYGLVGVQPGLQRADYLAARPALREAIDLLNAQAEPLIESLNLSENDSHGRTWPDEIERLFEHADSPLHGIDRAVAQGLFLGLVKAARRDLAEASA